MAAGVETYDADVWSVETLASTIRDAVSVVKNVRVVGRVGRVSRPNSGHAYFEIMGDTGARMSCVAWRSSSAAALVCDGKATLTLRTVDFYAPQGRCQAVVEAYVACDASHDLTSAERTLAQLKVEGALDRARRPLPDIVRHLAIVTSVGSAAHADMMDEVQRRWPGLRVTVVHTLVQGVDAPRSIERAIRVASRDADVLVCGRGGGSAADLAAFDDGLVARAIVATECPVVSAVGHETDHSVADAVADVRAKTPTAAIEMVLAHTLSNRTRELDKLRRLVAEATAGVLCRAEDRSASLRVRVSEASRRVLRRATMRTIDLRKRARTGASHALKRHAIQLDALRAKVTSVTHKAIDRQSNRLQLLVERLERKSPRAQFRRGFVRVRDAANKCPAFNPGDVITLQTEDEEVEVQVLRKRCRR